jgi:hypothetical protein
MFGILRRMFQRGGYSSQQEDLATIQAHGLLLEPIINKGLQEVAPWDIGPEGLQAVLALIRYSRQGTNFTPTDDFVRAIGDMLKFCKLTEHLIGFNLGGDGDLSDPYQRANEIKRRDKEVLNDLWRTLKQAPTQHKADLIVRSASSSGTLHERADRLTADLSLLEIMDSDFYFTLEQEFGHMRPLTV